VQDRRLDAAGAGSSAPSRAGSGKTVQLSAKYVDHVGSLELAVDENVEPERLLLAEAPLDFLRRERS